MNSLNILSGIGATPPPSPSRSRAGSESDLSRTNTAAVPRSRAYTDDVFPKVTDFQSEKGGGGAVADQWSSTSTNEKTPLLDQQEIETFGDSKRWGGWLMPKRIATAVVGGLKAVLTVAVAPARYLASCFYDDNGHFSTLMPLYRIGRKFPRKKRRRTSIERIKIEGDGTAEAAEDRLRRRSGPGKNIPRKSPKRSPSVSSTTSSVAITSDSESERPPTRDDDGPAKHTRSRSSLSAGDEIAPARRSIRIKLHNEDALRNRKQRKSRTASITKHSENGPTPQDAAVAALKSPTSPGPSSKLKFPRAPVPPRPLVPRRQPSYAANAPSQYGPHQKTLILDLDETLIHSMAKGGRYTTGHMVEVKLNQPIGAAGQIVGPQVPILYYVHKRPHCDDFLRKVSKWYNLVIFTASVQEYADPVIDWLELERKYFAGRFYRQHCTFRNGAYIKDLAQVEPDLSKVMIVDNSPMSYIFHEDNAIPIEGWISDPTDNDLLHLVPLLEGLQHVTDLRALLALRLGEPTAAA
ncbi:NLI interacting factor-like phosphatase-domain-containing protein [Phyllosticta citribraziliensis]